MERVLVVNTRTGELCFRSVTEEEVYEGGRSFIAHHFLRGVDPVCDPLGPKNKLIAAVGLLGDTSLTTAGRLSLGGKSPLTGGIKESNVGGLAGRRLARIGLKAVILEDIPEKPGCRVLVVRKDSAELIDIPDLKGAHTQKTIRYLKERFGDRPGMLCIGPAGEYKLGAAVIATTDHTGVQLRVAGRGGLGAVMGSKGIKAIIFDDTDAPVPTMAHPDDFREASRSVARTIREDPKTENRHNFGTPAVLSACNGLGILPTRNFSSGSFEKADEISGEKVAELIVSRGGEGKRGLPCVLGCIIACSNIFPHPDGKAHVASLQYENIALLGSNCGIGDLDEIADLNDLANEVGIDAIDGGAALGVVMEQGLLEFGDAEGAKKVLREVGEGTPLGRIIGSGAQMTGKVFGSTRIPTVKGQAMPAYDPRSLKGIGVTYAMSPMGADHTAGNTLETVRYLDPVKTEGQVQISHRLQIRGAVLDSFGVCLFLRPAFVKDPQVTARLLNARYGWSWSYRDVRSMAEKCLYAETEFNRKAGVDETRCDVPEFMRLEPLPPNNTVFDITREQMAEIWTTTVEEDVF
jgi:aldehyde:ferredoxin oxidoreductase